MFHLKSKMNQRTHLDMILKVLWPYLHLGPLDRVPVVFPVVPAHSFLTDHAGEVQTIQVGPVAIVVPLGAFMSRDTVAIPLVIIAILGGKCHTTLIT